MNIFAGNLSNDMTDDELREEFEAFGNVASATIIRDKFTGKSRGFGFVEMPEKEEAEAAIDALNEKEVMGRAMSVNEARPRPERRPSDRGRNDQRRGGGGGGGNRRR